MERARRYVQEAQDALMVFPDSPVRQALIAVSDYTVQRAR
jgi:geranylgeranyl pyrophosphate synthase